MTLSSISLGFTTGHLRDPAGGDYIPALDGYREGAAQKFAHLLIPSELLVGLEAKDVGEAAFIATNAPSYSIAAGSLAEAISTALYAAMLAGRVTRSVSVGDTVASALGRVACDKVGWLPA